MSDPAAIRDAVALARTMGLNALFFQVNSQGEAAYRSRLFPPAPGVTGDFDPLAFAVEQAHRAGLEAHAWINVYAWARVGRNPEDPDHPLRVHPDWISRDWRGRSLWTYRNEDASDDLPYLWVDPGLPAVQQYLLAAVAELLRGYAIDGLHLDYVRYPSTEVGYHPEAIRRFWQAQGVTTAEPLRFPSTPAERELWDRWRTDQVSLLVEGIARLIQAERPEVLFSAAVIADLRTARERRLQDWPRWLAEGWLDAVVPMAYSTDSQVVAAQLQDAVALRAGRQVWAGLGAYRLTQDPASLAEKVDLARSIGTDGVVLFSYQGVRGAREMVETLRKGPFSRLAPVPAARGR